MTYAIQSVGKRPLIHVKTMEIIGIVAGICTTSAVIPQLFKVIHTKQVKDVSIRMFIVLVTGFVLWIIYGISRDDLPIILTNGLSLALNGLMIILILKFGKKRHTPNGDTNS